MPDDTTPHGGEAMHSPPDRATIPRPSRADPGRADPQATGDVVAPAESSDTGSTPGSAVTARPALPSHPERMAADIEDEDADPVVESGPGVDDDTGKPSVTQHPAP